MSIAYWCVLVAALLPYVTVAIAKRQSRDGQSPYDNANPRAQGVYRGLARRAYDAHQNGFEAFPFFAGAVLVATRADPHAANSIVDTLAILWLGLRLAYTAAYLGNRATARSIVWLSGFAVAVAIFTIPAWHG